MAGDGNNRNLLINYSIIESSYLDIEKSGARN